MKKLILIITIFLCFEYSGGFAQTPDTLDTNSSITTRISGAHIFGAQIYNDNFFYNSGYSLSAISNYPISKQLLLGMGVSYIHLQDEEFIPIYFDILGYKNDKKDPPVINFQLGYSYGWSDIHTIMKGYDFDGGLFISVGTGKKINFSSNFSLLFQWAYQHQFAVMNYTQNNHTTSEILNYDMLSLILSIMNK